MVLKSGWRGSEIIGMQQRSAVRSVEATPRLNYKPCSATQHHGDGKEACNFRAWQARMLRNAPDRPSRKSLRQMSVCRRRPSVRLGAAGPINIRGLGKLLSVPSNVPLRTWPMSRTMGPAVWVTKPQEWTGRARRTRCSRPET